MDGTKGCSGSNTLPAVPPLCRSLHLSSWTLQQWHVTLRRHTFWQSHVEVFISYVYSKECHARCAESEADSRGRVLDAYCCVWMSCGHGCLDTSHASGTGRYIVVSHPALPQCVMYWRHSVGPNVCTQKHLVSSAWLSLVESVCLLLAWVWKGGGEGVGSTDLRAVLTTGSPRTTPASPGGPKSKWGCVPPSE